jgi:pyruvate dehydrogenase E1 component alpha subunit
MQMAREQLLRAYRQMRLIREFEERVHIEFAKGDMPGFVHLYAGEEASAVGVCMNLDERDVISSSHRGHGHSIAKDCDVGAMMSEIYGKGDGICGGKGGSMHIADLSKGMLGANGVVGAGQPLACGAALAAKYRNNGGVAVAFFGDGAANQGTSLESINLAGVLKLPLLFVIENNGYGETAAVTWHDAGGGNLVKRAEAFGMPGVQVDGTDFFAVHEAAAAAVTRAREGGGPTVIEVKFMRYYGHFEGDSQIYRGAGEVEKWRAEKDPLEVFRGKVLTAKLLEEAQLNALDDEAVATIDNAVAHAKAAAPPALATLLADVYVSY